MTAQTFLDFDIFTKNESFLGPYAMKLAKNMNFRGL